MAILPTDQAIVRFDANESLIDTWVNSTGTYTPNSGLPNVETIPSFMNRVSNNLNLVTSFNNRGAWTSTTVYAVNDLVSNSGTWYQCVVAHTSGATFAGDLSSKWRVYQGVTSTQLSATNGASMVGYNQGGTGAVTITQQAKNQQVVSVTDFVGADPTGATDSTAAYAAAFAALGSAGGTVTQPNGGKFLINSNLTIPNNVTLKGPVSRLGSPGTNTSYPYNLLGAIILSSSATITLKGGAGIDGCLIYRSGLSFPSSSTTGWVGTAVTVGGDDAFLINSAVFGFGQAFYSTGYQRCRVDNCNMDNIAGIWIDNCFDIPYISKVHCWPFVTVATGTSASSLRSGSAFRFSTVCDWGKVTDCMAYAYAKGYWVNGVNDMTFTNCSCDGTNTYTGSLCVALDGGGLRNKFIGCNFSSYDTGVYLGDTAGTYADSIFVGCHFTTCAVQTVNVQSSDVIFDACIFDATPYGIYINSTSARIQVNGCRFSNITTQPIAGSGSEANLNVSKDNDFGAFSGASPVQQGGLGLLTVASASPLVIPINKHFFQVSGTTGFNVMPYGWAGREVTIVFSGALTMTNGSGVDSLNLAGGTFTTGAGSILSLVHNGNNWFEKSRKA